MEIKETIPDASSQTSIKKNSNCVHRKYRQSIGPVTFGTWLSLSRQSTAPAKSLSFFFSLPLGLSFFLLLIPPCSIFSFLFFSQSRQSLYLVSTSLGSPAKPERGPACCSTGRDPSSRLAQHGGWPDLVESRPRGQLQRFCESQDTQHA